MSRDRDIEQGHSAKVLVRLTPEQKATLEAMCFPHPIAGWIRTKLKKMASDRRLYSFGAARQVGWRQELDRQRKICCASRPSKGTES